MNTPAVLTLLALSLFANAADTEISREDAAALPSVDPQKLTEKKFDYEGKIVRLKFNYRSEDVQKTKDGGATGTLFISQSNLYVTRTSKYGYVQVKVPEEGFAWFMKIPTAQSRSTLIVIGKVTKTAGSSPVVECLGREIKTDLKGSQIVW